MTRMKEDRETDTLILHRRMYERRMKRLRMRGGLTEQEIADQANDPSLFRKKDSDGSPEPGAAAANAPGENP